MGSLSFGRVALCLFVLSLFLPAIVYERGSAGTTLQMATQRATYERAECLDKARGNKMTYEACIEGVQTRLVGAQNSAAQKNTETMFGFSVLASGTFALIATLFGMGPGVGVFAVLSNIFFFLAYWAYTDKRMKDVFTYSLGALILAPLAFFIDAWPLDEAGIHYAQLLYLSYGYYVWAASFILMLLEGIRGQRTL